MDQLLKCREKISPELRCIQHTGDNLIALEEFITGEKHIDGTLVYPYILHKNDKIIVYKSKTKKRVIKVNDWLVKYSDIRGNCIIIVTEKQFKKHYELIK